MAKMLKIISVVGARPNFMKIAPFIRVIERHNSILKEDNDTSFPRRPKRELETPAANEKGIYHVLVHTGQHYDIHMSHAFFEQLNIPAPDINLEIGSGSHAEQVGQTMAAFEKVLREYKPHWVVLVGDVNATCACAITAKKEHVNVAHIEAGLRSFDQTMPEEINRMVTDRLSDYLFTTDELGSQNLRNEGVSEEKIKLVGNIMIDTLEANREKAAALKISDIIDNNRLEDASVQGPVDNSPGIQSGSDNEERGTKNKVPETRQHQQRPTSNDKRPTDNFAVLTLHRPSNVDSEDILEPLFRFFVEEVCADMPLIWPVHPRTRKQLERFQLWDIAVANPDLFLCAPIGYHEMLKLNMNASMIFTDSGGLQEECCVLGTPCLILRDNTERPVTLADNGGASILVGNNINRLRQRYRSVKSWSASPNTPPLWDGNTAERIVNYMTNGIPTREPEKT